MAFRPKRPGRGPSGFNRSARFRLSYDDTTPRISQLSPVGGKAAGGEVITIIGGPFIAGSNGAPPTVTFDGVPGTSVTILDRNTLTVITPAHVRGSVNIVITNDHNQSDTLVRGFVFVEPTITRLEPDHATIAGGTQVIISGVNFEVGAAIAFGGVPATGVTFIDSQHYVATTPAHAVGVVDVTVGGAVYHNFFFTLLTRGEDFRRNPSISINETWGSAPNTARFTVDGTSAPPQISEQIEITDYAVPTPRVLYRGIVQTVDMKYEEDVTKLAWDCVVSDFTVWANRRYPFGAYVDTSASDVVLDMVSRYAPWLTTNHVQTNLPKISVVLDGRQNFMSCLQTIGKLIGGAHPNIDYDQDLHFFRYVPNTQPTAANPETLLNLGPTTPMVVTESAVNISGFTFPAGYYVFRSSDFYSNGMESAAGPLSNMVVLQGNKLPQFANIDVNADPGGGITIVGRRIYFTMYGLTTSVAAQGWVQINDNTTTTVIVGPGGVYVQGGIPVANIDTVVPRLPYVAPPPGSVRNPSVSQSSLTPSQVMAGIFLTASNPTFAPGRWVFVETYVYQNGTESLPSDLSNEVLLTGGYAIQFYANNDNQVTGIPVIYRKVYAAQKPTTGDANFSLGNALGFAIIPHNIEGLITLAPGIKMPVTAPPTSGSSVYDTSNDGPWLEDDTVPDPIDDFNTDLQRVGTPITWRSDITQLRNRVIVIGQGVAQASPVVNPVVAGVPQGGVPLSSTSPETAPSTNGPRTFPTSAFTQLAAYRLQAYSIGGPSTYVYSLDAVAGGGYGPENPDVNAVITNMGFSFVFNARWYALLQKWGNLSQAEGRYGGGPMELFSVYAGFDPKHASMNPYTAFMDLPDGYYEPLFAGVPVTTPTTPAPLPAPPEQPPINVVRPKIIVNDVASQQYFGKIELDKNGKTTDGVHETVIDDDSLVTPEQMYARGQAEFSAGFSWPIITVNYATRGICKPGQLVDVNLSNPPIHGTFIIQSVAIDQIHDADDLPPRYTVTASSVKFELDDLLLLLATRASSGGNTDFSNLVPSAVRQSSAVAQASQAVIPVSTGGLQVATIDISYLQFAALSVTPVVLVICPNGSAIVPVHATFEQATYGDVYSATPSPFICHAGIGVAGSFFGTLPYSNGFNRYVWNTHTPTNGLNDGAFVQAVNRDLILSAQNPATITPTAPFPKFRITIVYYTHTPMGYP